MPGRPAPRRAVVRRSDVAAVASFAALALWVTSGLWLHPGDGVADNTADQAFFEWVIAHGARVVSEGAYPFGSHQMGFPDGVNLMANTSVLGISVPLAPVTLLLGPRVAFDAAITLGLFLTATAWFAVLSRRLLPWALDGGPRGEGAVEGATEGSTGESSREGIVLGAWVGALVCGFGPGMVSHANAHVNLVSQAVVPLLVWRTLALGEPGRWRRNGLVLAALVVWQVLVNAEMLLMVAMALLVVVLVLLLDRSARARWRPFVAGLLVTAVAAGVVLAYPLWVLFLGPGAYGSVPAGYQLMGAYLEAPVSFARLSLAGRLGIGPDAARLTQNPTEENSFFGVPLLLLCTAAAVVWARRSRVVLGLALVVVVTTLFSFGPTLEVDVTRSTATSMPWGTLGRLPVLESVVPTRWGLVTLMAIGVLVAIVVVRWWRARSRSRWVAGLGAVAALVVLVPLAPTPLDTARLDPAPAFVTDGTWRDYTAGDRSILFAPLADNGSPAPLRWAAETGDAMTISQGYFLTAGPGGEAIPTSPDRWLSGYIRLLGAHATDVRYAAGFRSIAVDDLRYWHTGAIVIQPGQAATYQRGLDNLLGRRPTEVGGVLVYDVRDLTS